MALKPAQLDAELKGGLKPAYLISGDEPLQIMEAADHIRAVAREQGYAERVVLTVETGFDWPALAAEAASTSLFAERRLLELRLGTAKPGKAGGAVLTDYLKDPPPDTVLLIQSARLDKAAGASAWVKALERVGCWIAVWPLTPAEMRGWLQRRLQAQGVTADDAAVALLLERTEGNLLAAAQEIAKLALLFPDGRLGENEVLEAVTGSARYDVNDLAEAVRAGAGGRVAQILDGLRAEGVEPTLVAWALAREARLLARLASGAPADALWRGIPPQRRKPVERAAERWRGGRAGLLVVLAARADRVVKGQSTGDPWDELLQLAFVLGGQSLFPPAWGLAAETGRVLL
ncbi:DNA polymerase III subunit delta [Acidihalobacter aeolianus]|uniref:DNA polymerase III subunit delta n=1 Tax=Acidihalobacter aeolianus TaxID=2792603 RepID=A0A1D8K9E1_9GAMM|nr:DNA polymerase III subunit delta [Acidihalobacter aeolianus]AOV17551.1 DNA polymerase III subunit delta [Acidihalobacter aeolianus]